MLTLKDATTEGQTAVYPFEVEYSGLLESGYSFTKPFSGDAVIAFGFKRTTWDSTSKVSDTTNHYLVTIRRLKSDGRLQLWVQDKYIGAKTNCTYTSIGEAVTEAMNHFFGTHVGNYSNMHVVDGYYRSSPYLMFYELSDKVDGLWVCKEEGAWTWSGEVFASGTPFCSGDLSGKEKELAFDGNTATIWSSNTMRSGTLGVVLASPATITSYGITPRNVYLTLTPPKNWKFQGSNNGTNWTTLDTRSGISGWSANTEKTFSIASPQTFSQYRIVVTDTMGNDWCQISEFKGYAEEANWHGPNGGRYDFSNAADLGTDSSANGNHWNISGSQSLDTPTQNGGVTAWKGLPEPTVLDTSEYADVLLRNGTGALAMVNSLKFQPDFVDIKCRSDLYDWYVYDSERGPSNAIYTSNSNVEAHNTNGLSSLNSNGYDLGTLSGVNKSGSTFLDLALKADPKAGFDIVTYTGDGVAGRQVAHDLGKAPTFIIVKRLDDIGNWRVYHKGLGATKYLNLNTADTTMASPVVWNDTEPTGTHFTLGSHHAGNALGGEYVAYVFTDSDVFKAFSYTGNGSATAGRRVVLDGRPLAIPFFKRTDVVTNWRNYDAVRDNINPVAPCLFPNATNVEGGADHFAFFSNGFKLVTDAAGLNALGSFYIGLAILQQPYKYSNAF